MRIAISISVYDIILWTLVRRKYLNLRKIVDFFTKSTNVFIEKKRSFLTNIYANCQKKSTLGKQEGSSIYISLIQAWLPDLKHAGHRTLPPLSLTDKTSITNLGVSYFHRGFQWWPSLIHFMAQKQQQQ